MVETKFEKKESSEKYHHIHDPRILSLIFGIDFFFFSWTRSHDQEAISFQLLLCSQNFPFVIWVYSLFDCFDKFLPEPLHSKQQHYQLGYHEL